MSERLNRLERVLMHIVEGLSFSTTLSAYRHGIDIHLKSEQFKDGDRYYMHFANWKRWRGDVRPGDIVLCNTSKQSLWKIAEVVQVVTPSECVLRSLRDDKLCRMSNESFTPIIGVEDWMLYTDEQLEFERKVKKAISKIYSYRHVFGWIEYNDDIADVYIRERYNGLSNPSLPYCVKIKWSNKTTIKSIVSSLQDAGFGNREFERDQG